MAFHFLIVQQHRIPRQAIKPLRGLQMKIIQCKPRVWQRIRQELHLKTMKHEIPSSIDNYIDQASNTCFSHQISLLLLVGEKFIIDYLLPSITSHFFKSSHFIFGHSQKLGRRFFSLQHIDSASKGWPSRNHGKLPLFANSFVVMPLSAKQNWTLGCSCKYCCEME